MTPLHSVQTAAMQSVLHLFRLGHHRQLVVMATGVGKTLWSIHLSQHFRRTLFLVHIQELLEQALGAYKSNRPKVRVGQVWGPHADLEAEVVVGMIPSLVHRLERIPKDWFDLVVVDEAHHARSRTWERVIQHFQPQLLVGVSATPNRTDGRSLLGLFDTQAFSYRLPEAIRDGLLVPPKILEVTTNQPLRVRRRGEDYDQHDLDRAIDTPQRNQLLVQTVAEYARDRKGVIYAAGVRHAQNLANMLRGLGFRAESVHGDDPERKAKLRRHREGELQFLTNAMLLVESYDDPTINLGAMGRPTASATLYEQALGRPARLLRQGRTWDGTPKTDYLWIDLMDVGLEDRCRVWEFFGNHVLHHSDRHPPRVRQIHEPPTRSDAIKAAYQELPPAYQKNIPLERYVTWADRLVEPPPFSLEESAALWKRQAATEAQLRVLAFHGYDVEQTSWTKADASEIIARLEPSRLQKARLLALGYDVLTRKWTKQQATQVFEEAHLQGRTPNWNQVRGLAPHLFIDEAVNNPKAPVLG